MSDHNIHAGQRRRWTKLPIVTRGLFQIGDVFTISEPYVEPDNSFSTIYVSYNDEPGIDDFWSLGTIRDMSEPVDD